MSENQEGDRCHTLQPEESSKRSAKNEREPGQTQHDCERSKCSTENKDVESRDQQCEQTLRDGQERITETRADCNEKLEEAKTHNEDKESDKVKSSCQQCEQIQHDYMKRIAEMQAEYKKLEEARTHNEDKEVKSSCQQCEQMQHDYMKRIAEMQAEYNKKLEEARTHNEDKEVKSSCQQCEQMQHDYMKRIAEMQAEYNKKLEEASKEDVKSSCQQCEQTQLDCKERIAEMQAVCDKKLGGASMTEMDIFYKGRLEETRRALKQTQEEFKSFKDRVAQGLGLSIKTGDTESMNNPVSKMKLIEMYDNLRIKTWQKMKENLKSNKMNEEFARALIQKMFEDSKKQMEKNKKLIMEMCGLDENSKGPSPQRVTEYIQLTIQNLQLALFYSRKEDVRTAFPEYKGENPQDVMVTFRHLAAECYWLGCLMALNNPPLEPHWKCDDKPNSTEIFPYDIASEMEPMEQ